jgi:hypothetical protein
VLAGADDAGTEKGASPELPGMRKSPPIATAGEGRRTVVVAVPDDGTLTTAAATESDIKPVVASLSDKVAAALLHSSPEVEPFFSSTRTPGVGERFPEGARSAFE